MFNILPTHKHEIDLALSSGASDIEDAFQYFTALFNAPIDYFVTRNKKDFRKIAGKLPVVSSSEFLQIVDALQ
ncbi:MAG: hypothetical protein LH473_13725 [Chitinophagales bacterium]|nr:hypothetical protein [Chitinophagales bacterium]